MKKLTLIVLIAMGCSDDEATKQSVTYEDLTGEWHFDSGAVSGTFEITETDGTYKVSSATYTINSNDYTAEFFPELEINTVNIENLTLNSNDGVIRFFNAVRNEDFTEIRADNYQFYEICCGGEEVDSEIVITR